MTPDIKAIKTRAESIKHLSMMVMNKHEVSAMCDEIERLRTALKLIEWSNDAAWQAQAATEALENK